MVENYGYGLRKTLTFIGGYDMIISDEVQKIIESTMELYKKRMIDEKFLEAIWTLSKLVKITRALLVIKEEEC